MYPVNSTGAYSKTSQIIESDHTGPTATTQKTDAYVTQLEAHHYLTEHLKKEISPLIHEFKTTDSRQRAEELKAEIGEKVLCKKHELFELRDKHFEIVNANTDDVYGVLKEHSTTRDRDEYIRHLMDYFQIKAELEKIAATPGMNANWKKELYMHHSTKVYGDLKALERLLDGNAAKVPALTYNQGSLQFG